MKPIAAALLGLAVAAAPALAQSGMSNATVEKQLKANESAIVEAVVRNDVKTFRSYVTADAISLDGAGMRMIADFDKVIAAQKITNSLLDDLRVHWLSPDVALVMSRWRGKGTYMGQPMPSPTRNSTVWVKQKDGKWLAAFHQETAAPEMPMHDMPGHEMPKK